MANAMDYLVWRGDVDIKYSPFNEVDNLLINFTVFIDSEDILPGMEDMQKSITLKEAAERYFEANKDKPIHLGALIPEASIEAMRQMALSRRFSQMKLSAFKRSIDLETQKQFSALTVDIGDGTKYVTFRGTDDTIVGWKENFNMSFLSSIPAQIDALDYLNNVACAYSEPLRIGGHSKGGNLAVYAAMHADPKIQDRIIDVFNNDGPGFNKEALLTEGYLNIHKKVKTIVPESSIVGMLLEHEDKYEIVKSTATGVMQHDGLSWEVYGNNFVHLDSLSGVSKYIDSTLSAWVNELEPPQKKAFVDAFYELLTMDGATTLTELSTGKLKKAISMIDSLREMDKQTRDMLIMTVRALIKEAVNFRRPAEAITKRIKKSK